MKFKFWLLAAFSIAAMTMVTSCEKGNKGEEPEPSKPVVPGEYTAVNNWMLSYMQEAYLWNTECKNLTPNTDLGFTDFLREVLEGVAKQNNANREDGHWKSGAREYYYTNITQTAKSSSAGTRFGELELTGYGFDVVNTTAVNGQYYFAVESVVSDSPADKVGINRGTYISRVDGTKITATNYQELRAKLNPAGLISIQLTCHTITGSGSDVTVSDGVVRTLAPATYQNNPILFLTCFSSKANPDLHCGYIAYKEFNTIFDGVLVRSFQTMNETANKYDKDNNPNPGPLTDLIIDLRNNTGGHLSSSVVMGTLVAGNAYKGQVYCATSYNEDRKKAKDLFKIGEADTPEGDNAYIAKALEQAASLKCVYILTTNSTASASELVINGLRGLGIEVRIIGDVTNGKNVGMEPISKSFDNYSYVFAPITTRLENGQGKSDYSDGFQPDVKIEDGALIGGYCTSADEAFVVAYTWITSGEKPTPEESATRLHNNILRVDGPAFIAPKMKGTYLNTKVVD